jgi:DNA invertase Pin-like site-specific DNA recombinase
MCPIEVNAAAFDVLIASRLDRLARSTRDLPNTHAAIADRKAGFRSLGDTWADTTNAHGRCMLTVPGGLAGLERELVRDRSPKASYLPREPRGSICQRSLL